VVAAFVTDKENCFSNQLEQISERKAMKEFSKESDCLLPGRRKKMTGCCVTVQRLAEDGDISANFG
jgi:hypothetical protein